MKNKKISLFKVFNYSFFIFLCVIMLYPFWFSLLGSVVSFSQYAQSSILLYPKTISFQAYDRIFTRSTIPDAYKITIFSAVVGTVLSLLMTTIGAYVFSRNHFPMQKTLFRLILFTMLFSGGIIPLFVTLSRYRLIDNIWVYVFPRLIATFYLIVMKTNFQGIPESFEDSARIDGCTDFGILFRIFVPISLPILATIALFYSVDRWNDLFTAVFFISSARKMNLQIVLYNMVTSVEASHENISGIGSEAMISEQIKLAAIMAATLPILFAYPFLQKYFVKGVLIGAVKG